MKSPFYRRSRPRATIHETQRFNNEKQQMQTFFGESHHDPFFKPSRAFGVGEVLQSKCDGCEKEKEQVDRQVSEKEKERSAIPTLSGQELIENSTRHYANCEGVTVEGFTDANYGNSYSAPGSSTPATDCEACSAEDCVTNTGTVISVFTANPHITLPSVPAGLNECEQTAVQNFINTTLRAHEQQHVAAFNTYRGTVSVPYTYHGCASGLDAYTQQIHDGVESKRRTKSDNASAALDANGANVFSISCNCPDPEPETTVENNTGNESI